MLWVLLGTLLVLTELKKNPKYTRILYTTECKEPWICFHSRFSRLYLGSCGCQNMDKMEKFSASLVDMVEIILIFLLEVHLYPCANFAQQLTSYPCYLRLFYLNESSIIRNVWHMLTALYQVFPWPQRNQNLVVFFFSRRIFILKYAKKSPYSPFGCAFSTIILWTQEGRLIALGKVSS